MDFNQSFPLSQFSVMASFTIDTAYLMAVNCSQPHPAKASESYLFDLEQPTYLSVTGEPKSYQLHLSSSNPVKEPKGMSEFMLILPNFTTDEVLDSKTTYLYISTRPNHDGKDHVQLNAGGLGVLTILNTDPISTIYYQFPFNTPGLMNQGLSDYQGELQVGSIGLQRMLTTGSTIHLAGREDKTVQKDRRVLVMSLYFIEVYRS